MIAAERFIELIESGEYYEDVVAMIEDNYPVEVEEMQYDFTYDDHGNGEVWVVYRITEIGGPVSHVRVYTYVEANEQGAELVVPKPEIVVNYHPVNK